MQDTFITARFGSRLSNAASGGLKNNTFRVHLTEESKVDLLVMKALVLGDFWSAVSLCLFAG